MKLQFFFVFILFSLSAFSQSRTEKLILEKFKEKFEYMNPKDIDKIASLLDDRLVYIHSNGNTESKTQLIQNVKSGKWKVKSVEFRDMNVRVYKNNFAIVVGKGLFHVEVNGEPIDTDLYFTEFWTHVKEGWLLASRHASKII